MVTSFFLWREIFALQVFPKTTTLFKRSLSSYLLSHNHSSQWWPGRRRARAGNHVCAPTNPFSLISGQLGRTVLSFDPLSSRPQTLHFFRSSLRPNKMAQSSPSLGPTHCSIVFYDNIYIYILYWGWEIIRKQWFLYFWIVHIGLLNCKFITNYFVTIKMLVYFKRKKYDLIWFCFYFFTK